MTKGVVVTGVGAVTPLGIGARRLFERWSAGVSGIEDGLGRCGDFDPRDHLGTKEVRRTDRSTQLAIVAADEAMDEAGLSEGLPCPAELVGCIMGTGMGGLDSLERQHDVLRERGRDAVSPLTVPLMMSNAVAGVVAMRHGLLGANFGVASACAAGAHAIGAAMRSIQSGECEIVVAGGAESVLTPLATAAFARMGATSTTGVSRPFDARRDGFVLGEGAGVVVLESEDSAAARGATVLGELLSYAATCDAYHLTAPQPDGSGASRAMRRALEMAGVEAGDVDYLNAHATSTPLNDATETRAIKSALGEAAYRVPISATKSSTGHLLGASGAVEAAVTVLALRNRVAPPTLNYEEADEELDLDYVVDGARALTATGNGRAVGLSNSFGFGGHNAVLCLAA
jgi:3-oxoacyl-[acyl-carrier-protein] synthase II